jgi:hypothetical protein
MIVIQKPGTGYSPERFFARNGKVDRREAP